LWWGWDARPRPLFWSCSEEYTKEIQDGIPLWYRGTPPRNFIPQQKEKDTERRKNMREKLDMVFIRRYFIYGLVMSLTYFFAVMKGETDIIMVYNVTSSG
jgi:hypothetical protein